MSKKVFIIGGAGIAESKLREITNVAEDTSIVCVNSAEDIPFPDRVGLDINSVPHIHQFTAPKRMYEPYFERELRQNHKRPYKYHR